MSDNDSDNIPNCEVCGCNEEAIGYFCDCHVPLCEFHKDKLINIHICPQCHYELIICDICFGLNGFNCC